MNDIIKRCEELERKVEDCSAKDVRDRIMQQLKQIDLSSTTTSSGKCEDDKSEKTAEHARKDQWLCSECRSDATWRPEEHKRVREELLRCLDRISLLEKNFADAQKEIQVLRKYIKDSAENKEFTEKTYKR